MRIKEFFLFIALSGNLCFGESLEEKWNDSLALQAATWGAPLVMTYAMRYDLVLAPYATVSPNALSIQTQIVTPVVDNTEVFASPCPNLFYGSGWLDLRGEPYIITVPDSHGLFYSAALVDAWANTFGMMAGKANGYRGGKFMVASPGWDGDVPEGVVFIRAPTPWVALAARAHIYMNQKLVTQKAIDVLNGIKLVGLSQYLGNKPLRIPEYNYPIPVMKDSNLPITDLDFQDPMQFWDILMRTLAESPPPQDQINALMPMFTPLGMIFGNEWDPTVLHPKILNSMKKVASRIGNILSHLSVGTMAKGVNVFPATSGGYGTDYKSRAVLLREGSLINTPGDSIYWNWLTDSEGKALTGTNQYTLTFKSEPSFIEPGFWSVTVYDNISNNVVPNTIGRYMLGSDSQGLKKNEDGSITIYIQSTSPGEDKESNWLPTITSPFYVMGRVYLPTESMEEIILKQDPSKLPPLIFVGQ